MTPPQHKAVHVVVRGRVQGVGFRAFVEHHALSRGVEGWVRNLYDGRVEIWVEGSAEAIADLEQRAQRGPTYAEVQGVMRTEVEPRGHFGFHAVKSADRPEG